MRTGGGFSALRIAKDRITFKMKHVFIFLIKMYRVCISPLMGPGKCRFIPTCSEYAIEAIQKYGALKGGILGIKRVLRCHPGCPGGYDPVP